MSPLSTIFFSTAWAQGAAAVPADANAATQTALMSYVPFVLIFVVFYVLVIRPQQKRMSDQDKMIKALQRGDRVVLSSGIHGKVSKVESNDVLMIEIANGVEIKVDRLNVQSLEAKPKPLVEGEKK